MDVLKKPVTILIADDDPDDRMLALEALNETHLTNNLYFVEDGEELLDYLHRRGQYTDFAQAPRPGIILVDLNMPRKDGREAIREIKTDPALRHIPLVAFTTSKAEEDVARTYGLGVNSYIIKPASFEGLVEVMQALRRYWFEAVVLPPSEVPA